MVIVDHKLAGCGIVYGEEAQLFINGAPARQQNTFFITSPQINNTRDTLITNQIYHVCIYKRFFLFFAELRAGGSHSAAVMGCIPKLQWQYRI